MSTTVCPSELTTQEAIREIDQESHSVEIVRYQPIHVDRHMTVALPPAVATPCSNEMQLLMADSSTGERHQAAVKDIRWCRVRWRFYSRLMLWHWCLLNQCWYTCGLFLARHWCLLVWWPLIHVLYMSIQRALYRGNVLSTDRGSLCYRSLTLNKIKCKLSSNSGSLLEDQLSLVCVTEILTLHVKSKWPYKFLD